MTTEPTTPDPMQTLADHLSAIAMLIEQPDVAGVLREGLQREFRYALASFRTRFPDLMQGSQQPLFS